ncbi:hypothetical protein KM043_017913 [Ampulex compressa]|nr:hypothetical protein KM043_017913 [Ampulex compressa]
MIRRKIPKKEEKRLETKPETRRRRIIAPDTPLSSSYDGQSTSWIPRGVEKPTTEKVHGASEDVVGGLSTFLFIGSGLGFLYRLERGDAKGRKKNRRTHRSVRRKVKSKVGTDLSFPPDEGAIGTHDGEDSEMSIETSSQAPSAASSREKSRSASGTTKRRGSTCVGTDADTALEISGLRHEVENLRAELDRYRRAEEDRAGIPSPTPPAEVVQRKESAMVTMMDTMTPPVTRQSAKRTAFPFPSNRERDKGKKGRKGENLAPYLSPAPRSTLETPQSSGELLSLGRDEIQRMIEESVEAALRVFFTNLEKTIGEHIGRSLGGSISPIAPGQPRRQGPKKRFKSRSAAFFPREEGRGVTKRGQTALPPRSLLKRRRTLHLQTGSRCREETPPTTRLHGPRSLAGERRLPQRKKSQHNNGLLRKPRGDHARAIAEATGMIGLYKVGLEEAVLAVRKDATGALVIEVPGQNHANKADKLVGLMREVLRKEVKSAHQNEDIRQSPRRQQSIWLRLPLVSATQAAAGGKLCRLWVLPVWRAGAQFKELPGLPQLSTLLRLRAPKYAQDRIKGSGCQQKGRKNTSPPVVAPAELQPIAGCSGVVQKRNGGQNIAPPAVVESVPPIIFDGEQKEVDGNSDGVALPQRQLRVHLKTMDDPVMPTPLRQNKEDNLPDTGEPAE